MIAKTTTMQLSTAIPTQPEVLARQDAYRLVVFNQLGTAVLLEGRPGQYRLPLVKTPRLARPAEEITAHLENQWQVSSVLLYVGFSERGPDTVYSAILEAQARVCSLPVGIEWLPISDAIGHLLKNQDQKLLDSSYLKVTSRTPGEDLEPFSRLGWLTELQNWVRSALRPLGMELKGFHQLNGCETFSLIRFDTSRYPVWFKAVGEPNLHEYGISQTLARLLPDNVPAIIAARPDWHGWLMADAGGAALRDLEEASAWESAVANLGALQIESTGQREKLLEGGCRDLSMSKLLGYVAPYLECAARLMSEQAIVPPAILSREELSELGEILTSALHCLGALGIPDSLGHCDPNPGNIIVRSQTCVFLDWAEAYVGHPFFTMEYLLAHLRKDCGHLKGIERTLRDSYSAIWRPLVSQRQIVRAFEFSPLVAVFAYAVSTEHWWDPERLRASGGQGYLRSLTRRMKREADLIQRRKVECLR